MQFWALWPAVKKAMTSGGEKEREEGIEEAQLHLNTLETQLKEKKFFGGERLGFVEISASLIIWIVVSQEVMGVEILTQEKFPALHKLTQKFVDDDVFKQCVPPWEPLVAYFKAQLGALAASK